MDIYELAEANVEHLERVSSRIGAAVVAFLRGLPAPGRFRADDLRKAVMLEAGLSAPASADRVLRDLRKRGVVSYRVLSRKESLYELVAVGGSSWTAKSSTV